MMPSKGYCRNYSPSTTAFSLRMTPICSSKISGKRTEAFLASGYITNSMFLWSSRSNALKNTFFIRALAIDVAITQTRFVVSVLTCAQLDTTSGLIICCHLLNVDFVSVSSVVNTINNGDIFDFFIPPCF